jgi:NAD(P)-dependent dehydrogenase (short-subunit alcohol dehydrogenase family)
VTGALDGLRALVIGGGSGIGLASARLLARDGALVTISGRTAAKLEAAAGRGRARPTTSRRRFSTCSDPSQPGVTGQLLAVDGGHTLRSFVNYADLMDIPDVREAVDGRAS